MIAHLFNSSSVSGPEQLVLPALAAAGDLYTIINLREDRIDHVNTSDPMQSYAQSWHLPYRAIPVRSRWDRSAIGELRRLLEELKPELVHAHAIKASIYLARAARSGAPCPFPIVSTHHGVHGLPDLKYRAYEWFYRKFFLRSFDRVLCVSRPDYADVRRSGIREDRLRLHLNGVDRRLVALEDRAKEAAKIRAQWLPDERNRDGLFLFGVIARLSSEKDHARIINVLSRLNRLPGDADWRCLMFGAGPLERTLRKQAEASGLNERVIWMGYRKEVGNELAGLDILLSFSKAEGLPISLIEAGWAGTPVMCTPVGGVADLIPNETYGQWVQPGEPASETARRLQAILTPQGHEKLRAQAARFQKRVIAEFNQSSWLRRLRDIYTELHAGTGQPS